ncbi:hypothetical protein BD289DRAFT_107171 [Coniella lustricola]|uniref:RING-type domain-containing protein n=1 Tax=Coniella lustricola TaxID=2025994 RepID=A0A2T3AGH2_9PEZI|nr:hypothetical protein BD289DRAFT_107171 [Coniella lustricola]
MPPSNTPESNEERSQWPGQNFGHGLAAEARVDANEPFRFRGLSTQPHPYWRVAHSRTASEEILYGSLPTPSPQSDQYRTAEECEVPWPIDWQALDYVDKVDDNLMCSICRTPFDLPVSTNPCDHSFCRPCLDQYLHASHGNSLSSERVPCPVCRTSLDHSGWAPGNAHSPAEHVARPSGRLLLAMLDQLTVKCPNNPRLCTWTGPRSTLLQHIRSHCRFTKVHCVSRNCTQLIVRGSQSQECQHFDTICSYCEADIVKAEQYEHLMLDCPTYIEKCSTCRDRVPRDQMVAHQIECWQQPGECLYASDGCTAKAKRGELQSHQLSCIYGQVSLLRSSFAQRMDTSDSLALSNRTRVTMQLQQLSTKTEDTHVRMRRLEGEVRALSEENRALKTALAEQQEKQLEAMSFNMGPAGPAAGGLLSELDSRNTEMLQYLHDQGARQFAMLQNRLKPLEEGHHDLNGRLGSLEMQVRWLRSIGRLQQRQNNLGSGMNATSQASSETSVAARDGVGEASSAAGAAAERRLSDQMDRARM